VEVTTILRSPAASTSIERLRVPVDAIIFNRGRLSITPRDSGVLSRITHTTSKGRSRSMSL
jgi:hypothetical protein